jgi:hypothetical protein
VPTILVLNMEEHQNWQPTKVHSEKPMKKRHSRKPMPLVTSAMEKTAGAVHSVTRATA